MTGWDTFDQITRLIIAAGYVVVVYAAASLAQQLRSGSLRKWYRALSLIAAQWVVFYVGVFSQWPEIGQGWARLARVIHLQMFIWILVGARLRTVEGHSLQRLAAEVKEVNSRQSDS